MESAARTLASMSAEIEARRRLQALTRKALKFVVRNCFMDSFKTKVKRSEMPRQTDDQITGLQLMGNEYTVQLTAEMPIMDREAVKISRTCKRFLGLSRTWYGQQQKDILRKGLWDMFTGIVVQKALAMEENSSGTFTLCFVNEVQRLCVCVYHQQMKDPSFEGVQMRHAFRFTELGGLTIFPHNEAEEGERDSRTDKMLDWLAAAFATAAQAREVVSVLA